MKWPSSPESWSAVIGAVVASLALAGAFTTWIARRIKSPLQAEIEMLRQENGRLRDDMDKRLHLPTFALDRFRFVEAEAEQQIRILKDERDAAVQNRDRESTATASETLDQLEVLQRRLDHATTELSNAKAALSGAMADMPVLRGPNAVVSVYRSPGAMG